MNTDENKKLKKLIETICEEYKTTMSDQLKEIWVEYLNDFDFEIINQSIKDAISECNTRPRLSDVLRFARLHLSTDLAAIEAWIQLIYDIKKSSIPNNKIILKIIDDLGGVEEIIHTTLLGIDDLRADFISLYKIYSCI